jgi:hypothetical protein
VEPKERKPFIDVIENVFSGVRVTTEDEGRNREVEPDFRPRPWLSVSDARVTLSDDSDDRKH